MKRKAMAFAGGAVAILFFAASLPADVVHLKSGGRIEGAVSADGDALSVETSSGVVRVARRDVASIESKPTPLQEYASRAKEAADADGHCALGRWCDQQGLSAQARAEYERALQCDPQHSGARKALGHVRRDGVWMTPADAKAAEGLVEYRGEWITPGERSNRQQEEFQSGALRDQEKEVSRLLDRYRISRDEGRLYAFLMIENYPDAARVRPLLDALKSPQEELRALAAAELARIGDAKALPALTDVVLSDKSEALRALTRDALVRHIDRQALMPQFVRALGGPVATLRKARALEVLAAMVQPDDDWVLVEVWKEYVRIGGGGPRQYLMSGSQKAYVRDFNPQVSTDAIVLDPVVGVVQEAAVIDLKLIKTEERFRVLERQWIRRAFARAGGPENPAQWAEWLKKQQEKERQEKAAEKKE